MVNALIAFGVVWYILMACLVHCIMAEWYKAEHGEPQPVDIRQNSMFNSVFWPISLPFCFVLSCLCSWWTRYKRL